MNRYKEVCIENEYIAKVDGLSKRLESHIYQSIDVNNQVFCYINGVAFKDDCLELRIAGRGYTYAEACEDYWNKLLHPDKSNYQLVFKWNTPIYLYE